MPGVELEGWTTSLGAKQFDAAKIMALYADHGTYQQFHADFKTNLDLERLPSGKFDTNYLVCQLAVVAMNRATRRVVCHARAQTMERCVPPGLPVRPRIVMIVC